MTNDIISRVIITAIYRTRVNSNIFYLRPNSECLILSSNKIKLSLSMHSIYVIELSKRVFNESKKFREANPQFNSALQCLYVGMTSKTPKERFEQHKTGARSKKGHKISSNIVEKYGLYLRPSLYNHIPKFKTKAEAEKMEEQLALELRRKRYAVWFN